MTVEETMLDEYLIPTDTVEEELAYADDLEEIGGYRLTGRLLLDEAYGDVCMEVDGRIVGVCSELIGYLGGRSKRVELWMYEDDFVDARGTRVLGDPEEQYVEATSLYGECELAYGLVLTGSSKTRRIRKFEIDGEDVRELLRSYVDKRVSICVLSSDSSRERVAMERFRGSVVG